MLVLDHYLEVLWRKPGALPGSTALSQARAAGTFTAAHDAFWAAARRQLGDAEGTRALVEVLLLHRHQVHADVVAGLQAAVGWFGERRRRRGRGPQDGRTARRAGPGPGGTAADRRW